MADRACAKETITSPGLVHEGKDYEGRGSHRLLE
jgi:hypothetical protein